MVSFDVESLLTNVPIDASVQAALQKLQNDPSLADHTKTDACKDRRPPDLRIEIDILPV